MDIAAFRTFLAAAEAGTFLEAARRLHASPSSVTERIRVLEDRVGARLFDRDKRGCRLTGAGMRFLPHAEKIVRAWEIARDEAVLPEGFSRSLTLGAQYVFWDERLMEAVSRAGARLEHIALRLTVGASSRLSRDLGEGLLDVALVFDPVFRRGIQHERLIEDELVLVTGGDPHSWQEDYVPIEWGKALDAEIAAKLGFRAGGAVTLNLGARSADWLVMHAASGYLPRRTLGPLLESGRLRLVEQAPSFALSAYLSWHGEDEQIAQLAGVLADEIRRDAAGHQPPE